MGEIWAMWIGRRHLGVLERLIPGVFWERIQVFWCERLFLRLSFDRRRGGKGRYWAVRSWYASYRTFEGWMELSETIDRGNGIGFHAKHPRLY